MTTTIRPSARETTPSAPMPLAGASPRLASLLPYLLLGTLLGIILVKSEVVSWYRVQEMFRFQSFHMYGVLGSACLTALISLRILRRLGVHARNDEAIAIPRKEMAKGHRYWMGGSIFGVGWALCGACPGPLFALIGSGTTVYLAAGASALVGTWTYGYLRPKLLH